jgi:hypothetical protein
VILAIARRLAAELRRRDPLAERVELGRGAFFRSALFGFGHMLWSRRSRPVSPALRPKPR